MIVPTSRDTCLWDRFHLIDDFKRLWEAAGLVFAVNEAPVTLDVEHAATTLHKNGFNPDLILNQLRQTGGLGVVVSLGAIGDAYRHVRLLPYRRFSRP